MLILVFKTMKDGLHVGVFLGCHDFGFTSEIRVAVPGDFRSFVNHVPWGLLGNNFESFVVTQRGALLYLGQVVQDFVQRHLLVGGALGLG